MPAKFAALQKAAEGAVSAKQRGTCREHRLDQGDTRR